MKKADIKRGNTREEIEAIKTIGIEGFKWLRSTTEADDNITLELVETEGLVIDSLRSRIENPNTTIEEVKELYPLITDQEDRRERTLEAKRKHNEKIALAITSVIAFILGAIEPKQAKHFLESGIRTITPTIKSFKA